MVEDTKEVIRVRKPRKGTQGEFEDTKRILTGKHTEEGQTNRLKIQKE